MSQQEGAYRVFCVATRIPSKFKLRKNEFSLQDLKDKFSHFGAENCTIARDVQEADQHRHRPIGYAVCSLKTRVPDNVRSNPREI
ncbi:uncharacterized protein MAM_05676 [Metarhizium album ARSEF 1941]|uniref:Uncharacterized protein n=1 Tax=Metarhizium album (strain ARSEF 1941) TaxID=1081103 RepID=A0A0B2WSC6_METAS|nr:uncharacterized protein MAM_05676 [Metarhizium album ARSEF 1941]KHN96387.1 hypothetical protein MAM_05676 [Metarhizium album ARSEF 1941]